MRGLLLFVFSVLFSSHAIALPLGGSSSGSDQLSNLVTSMCSGCWADAGTVAGVTAPQIQNVFPVPAPAGIIGPPAVTQKWSGGALDTVNNQFLVWGGGHTDYCGNEVYAFKLKTLNWVRITNPSTCDTNNTGAYADGNPSSRHTYAGIVFLPTQGEMFEVGGAVYQSGGADNSHTWLFNPVTLAWTNTGAPPAGLVSAFDDQAVYNPADGNVYAVMGGGSGIFKYTVSSGTWSTTVGGSQPDFHNTGVFDQTNNRLVSVGNGFLYYTALDGTVTNVSATSTGDKTCQNYNAAGVDWHPGTGEIVCFVPGNATVYRLNPTTFSWTAQTPNAANAVTPAAEDVGSNGVFGRWRWDPNYGVFIAVVNTDSDVYIYKPSF